jgi:rhamnulokinase
VIRCALESLALLYRCTFVMLEKLTGRRFMHLHIVGGGSKNELLNQFTANALGLPVLAGPVEATALGNVLVQAIALGDLSSLAAARDRVRHAFPFARYQPREVDNWKSAEQRFLKMRTRG